MDKQALLEKTRETLTPLETQNVVGFLKTLSVKSAMEHPLFLVLILLLFVFGIVKRSKFVLLALFAAVSIMLLVRFFAPAEGDALSASSTLPFAFGGLAIGGALIYFIFIKAE